MATDLIIRPNLHFYSWLSACVYFARCDSHQACCSASQSTIIPFIITIIKSIHYTCGWLLQLVLNPSPSYPGCLLLHLSLRGNAGKQRVVWCVHTKRGKADQRDAPAVCLILSYVSRLNGSHRYQHHHSSASCQRPARTNTAEIWHDSGQGRLWARDSDQGENFELSLNDLTTGEGHSS